MNNAPTNVDTQAISEVRKRDGRIVPFDMTRIEQAISRAFKAVEEGSEKDAARIASLASDELVRLKGLSRDPRFLPSIELIQDTVEQVLMREEFGRTAKAYILYRQKRAELRENRGIVSKEIRELAEASKQYFKNSLGEFIYYRSYSRWMPEKGRRETWIETVNRYMGFMREILGGDRKSTRLNSSHSSISYAVFFLKKNSTTIQHYILFVFSGLPMMLPKQFSVY